ncbi:CU044_2847 family protein [Nonomuraea sp. M3C6]|uniref:CU044_2847 family protein n=1 Tax=Nonomuraea marmarensis TaxID=3351344 RepID=A0ABW7A7W2_9ACTN
MRVVELPVGEEGHVVKVEIQDRDGDAPVRVGRAGRAVARASRSFGEMLDTIRPVAEKFVASFGELPQAPDEITVEFGVTFSAEADVVIASTATDANFAVTLSWKGKA